MTPAGHWGPAVLAAAVPLNAGLRVSPMYSRFEDAGALPGCRREIGCGPTHVADSFAVQMPTRQNIDEKNQA